METWSVPPENLQAALDVVKPELMAVPKDQLRVPFLVRARVMDITTHAIAATKQVEHRFADVFSAQHVAKIMDSSGKLMLLAHAYYLTELDTNPAEVSSKAARRHELGEILWERDQTLLAWVRPAVRNHPEGLKRLAAITPGTGTRDTAEDVVKLVEICHDYHIRNDEITDSFLDESYTLATEQLGLLAGDDVEVDGSPVDMRRRAFTVWFRHYSFMVAAARYAAGLPPALNVEFPSAVAERSKSTAAVSKDQPTGGTTGSGE